MKTGGYDRRLDQVRDERAWRSEERGERIDAEELKLLTSHELAMLAQQSKPSQFGRYLFRYGPPVPPERRPGRQPSTLTRRAPPRRRQQQRPTLGQDDDLSVTGDESGAVEDHEDEDTLRVTGSDPGGDGGERTRVRASVPGDDEDAQAQARHVFARPSQPHRTPAQCLSQSGLPGAAALVDALVDASGARRRRGDEASQALALALRDAAWAARRPRQDARGARDSRDPRTRAKLDDRDGRARPSPAAVRLAALQACLSGEAGEHGAPASLAQVKAWLMNLPQQTAEAPAAPPASGDAGDAGEAARREASEDALLLLPLQLLNATRPRTQAQRRRAVDRLQMLRDLPGAA